jgi:hypothetical protein
MQGIPHAVVFDAAGKLVFAGHPADDEFERTIKKSLRDVNVDGDAGDDDAPLDVAKPVIETRNWTNDAGKTISASVLSIADDKVKFKLSNGKEVDYPIAKLSEDDQTLIKETAEKQEEE